MAGPQDVGDYNRGYTPGSPQVWGFSAATGVESGMFGAPGAKRFYVDPNHPLATDPGNLGENPTVPLATVQAAVDLCRDHMGDTIFVAGNDDWIHAPHNRTVPILESVVVPYTKGGIRIVGVSSNPRGVCWSPAATGEAALTVDAIDVLIEGFCFQPVAGVANAIGIFARWDSTSNYYGDNLTVRGCHFSSGLDHGIVLDFSYYTQIYGNYFDGAAVADIVNTGVIGDPDFLIVCDNVFRDVLTAMDLPSTDYMVIEGNKVLNGANGLIMSLGMNNIIQRNKFITDTVAISGRSANDNIISGNEIDSTPAGVDNFIDLAGGTGNLVADNWLACTILQYDTTCSDGASGVWVRNHCQDGETAANPT
jgi:hypothetical protein